MPRRAAVRCPHKRGKLTGTQMSEFTRSLSCFPCLSRHNWTLINAASLPSYVPPPRCSSLIMPLFRVIYSSVALYLSPFAVNELCLAFPLPSPSLPSSFPSLCWSFTRFVWPRSSSGYHFACHLFLELSSLFHSRCFTCFLRAC